MNTLGNKEVMAKNIQYYMDKKGIDRRKLSNDLNISYTTLTDWIKAKTYPRIDKIELLANYFSISKADLVEKQLSKDNSILSLINETSSQLSPPRQQKVYDFATKELEEQKQEQAKNDKTPVIPIESNKEDSDEIYTFAAHSDAPDKTYTDEEISEIEAFLDEVKADYDKKHNK